MRDDPVDLQSPSYTPWKLFNRAAAWLGVDSLCALARVREVDKAMLSRMHNRKIPLTAYLLVRIMDRTGWHIREVRALAGMPYEGPSPQPQGATP